MAIFKACASHILYYSTYSSGKNPVSDSTTIKALIPGGYPIPTYKARS